MSQTKQEIKIFLENGKQFCKMCTHFVFYLSETMFCHLSGVKLNLDPVTALIIFPLDIELLGYLGLFKVYTK